MVENKTQKLMVKYSDIFENLGQAFSNSCDINFLITRFLSKSSPSDLPEDIRTQYQRKSIIRWMILMKFLGIDSIHQTVQGEWKRLLYVGKDVLYKVKNNEWINWRKLLLNQAMECTKEIEVEYSKTKSDTSTIPCFIIDDTDINKRGKCIEWIGKIFSHVSHTYTLGFKSLNLAYWSGKHLVHVDFSMHAEMGKKKNQGMKAKHLKGRYKKKRNATSPGSKRISEVTKKKTQVVTQMLKRAVTKGFVAEYVLADSWFFNSNLAKTALDVCMTKCTKLHKV